MQAAQALQRVIARARGAEDGRSIDPDDPEELADEEAMTLCEQILTVAIPIARFRCYVTVEKIGNKAKIGLGDFAINSIDIAGIKNGLIGLSMEHVSVYIQLWEHREEGKFDMLCGYQGQTKNLGFRSWLRDIDRHQIEKPTNAIQMNGHGPSQS